MIGVPHGQKWYEKFVRTWQRHKHLKDVALIMGINPHNASNVAKHLREKDVPLKLYKRGLGAKAPLNYEKLRKIAEVQT